MGVSSCPWTTAPLSPYTRVLGSLQGDGCGCHGWPSHPSTPLPCQEGQAASDTPGGCQHPEPPSDISAHTASSSAAGACCASCSSPGSFPLPSFQSKKEKEFPAAGSTAPAALAQPWRFSLRLKALTGVLAMVGSWAGDKSAAYLLTSAPAPNEQQHMDYQK